MFGGFLLLVQAFVLRWTTIGMVNEPTFSLVPLEIQERTLSIRREVTIRRTCQAISTQNTYP